MRTLGIDIGTSNCLAAVEGEVVRAPEPGGKALMPSVVAFKPEGGVVVGEHARDRLAVDPLNTLSAVKRLMGQPFRSEVTRAYDAQYLCELEETAAGTAFRTCAGLITPTMVCSKLLSGLMEQRQLQAMNYRAILAVPMAYDESARQAVIQAAASAGVLDAHVVDEPTAVALAHIKRRSQLPEVAAVYNLGGGTFHFAVMDFRGSGVRMLGAGGDAYLGGDDIDAALARRVASIVRERHGWDIGMDLGGFERLKHRCERAKIVLSRGEPASLDVRKLSENAPSDLRRVKLEPGELAALSGELVRRTFVTVDDTMRAAGIAPSQVQTVLMAGGGSNLPAVRAGLQAYFNREPTFDYEPTHVVAIGASLFGSA